MIRALVLLLLLAVAVYVVLLAARLNEGMKRRPEHKKGSQVARLRQYIDLDTDAPIPMGDDADPTSLMFTLSMEHGAVFVDHSSTGEAIVEVGGQRFTGADDLTALRRAREALNREPTTDEPESDEPESRFIADLDARLQQAIAENPQPEGEKDERE